MNVKAFYTLEKVSQQLNFSHITLYVYIIRNYKFNSVFDKNLYTYLVSFFIYNHVQYIA